MKAAALALWLALAPGLALAAEAPPILAAIFQDHAVLQRDRPIRVWGSAAPGEDVTVSLAGESASAHTGPDGRWEASLGSMPAGGPYALTARTGGRTQTVQDLLVGDVWLCSGQSNMVLQVNRTLNSRAEIADSANDSIRLFTVPNIEMRRSAVIDFVCSRPF